MDRRRFLRTGTRALAVALAGASTAGASELAALAAAPLMHPNIVNAGVSAASVPRRFALAYLEGSDDMNPRSLEGGRLSTWRPFDTPAPADVSAAGRRLRITVHGIQCAPDSRLRAVAVAALFRVDGVAEPVPFHAWSFAQGQPSSPVRFHADRDTIAGFAIDYRLEVQGECRDGAETCAVHDAVASELPPGRYVIAGPRRATGLAPQLGSFTWAVDPATPMSTVTGGARDFDYISFTVARA
jgi:hypothetical protein